MSESDFRVGDLVRFTDAAFDNRYGLVDESLGIIVYDKNSTATLAMVFWFSSKKTSWCWKRNLEKISR